MTVLALPDKSGAGLQCQARVGERIATLSGFADEERAGGVRPERPGMGGEVRDERDGPPCHVSADGDPCHHGSARRGVDHAERPEMRIVEKPARKRAGFVVRRADGRCFGHGASGLPDRRGAERMMQVKARRLGRA